MKKDTKEVSFFIYASNEPKSMIETLETAAITGEARRACSS